MTNNDIIRRVRYLFNFGDDQMIAIFKNASLRVTRAQVSDWLKKEDDPSLVDIADRELAVFLNGLIIEKRGRKEGPMPQAEDRLSNNMILHKLKIALSLTSDDIISLYASIEKPISKPELSAFLRNPNHAKYQPFMDQYLRNFLNALSDKYKGKKDDLPAKTKKAPLNQTIEKHTRRK